MLPLACSRGLPRVVGRRWCSVAACERITRVGAAANVGLCVVKGGAGVIAGSPAMVADGFHSLGDLVSDGVTIAALRYSRQPPDETHPFGKGKFESLGTLTVAGLLVGTAGGIASFAWTAILGLAPPPSHLEVALLGGAISVAVKEWLYRATVKVGREAGSEVTVANAWHHRSDALSSVVAVAGIGGAMLGYPFLDPLAGGLVAAMILKTGLEIGWDSLKDLTDTHHEVSDEIRDVITAAVERNGAVGVTNLRARKMGPYLGIYMTLVVDSVTSVSVGAQMARDIEADIRRNCEKIQSVICTVAPRESLRRPRQGDMPDTSGVKERIDRVVANTPEVVSITHFTPHFLGGCYSIQLVVIMDPKKVQSVQDATAVARRLEAAIMNSIPSVKQADVHLELRPLQRSCLGLAVEGPVK
eukprot:Sspe_Gene.104735::Locus_81791_Transcript_2_2_Confidence_0.667_Length_1837::g.104735::m.104735